jgi:K+-transporting ATPase ATPase C chain
MKIVISSLLFFLMMTLLTGVLYPGFVTLIGQVVWPEKSAGSLVYQNDQIKGSALIAQKFSKDRYFWPRPSASDYSALPSAASNLGPSSKALLEAVNARRQKLLSAHQAPLSLVPEELLTASGSGLDPHLSKKAALFQCARIARARGLDQTGRKRLEDMVKEAEEQPFFALLGTPVINVFLLNLAMDKAFDKIVQ